MNRQDKAELLADICVELAKREKAQRGNGWHELMGVSQDLLGLMIQRRHHEDGTTSVVVYDSVDDWKNNREPLVVRSEQ